MNITSFIPELKKFIVSTSEKCFFEIGEELKQNALNLEQLKLIDYMRYAEFSAIYTWLSLKPGQRILDVSSPQWFSIFGSTVPLMIKHPCDISKTIGVHGFDID